MNEDKYLELLQLAGRVIQKQDTGLGTAATWHQELSETLRILVTSKKEDMKFPVTISRNKHFENYTRHMQRYLQDSAK